MSIDADEMIPETLTEGKTDGLCRNRTYNLRIKSPLLCLIELTALG